jgi:Zn-dependent protease
MDVLGTFILPLMAILYPGAGIFFGWAKPVPVNERNLKNPRVDMFWIALAGPASNLLLAFLTAVIIFIMGQTIMSTPYYRPTLDFLEGFISINLFLAVFNALPLHPLDGGKILARFLPRSANYWLEQREHISSMVLLALFLFGATSFLIIPVRFLHGLLLTMAGV